MRSKALPRLVLGGTIAVGLGLAWRYHALAEPHRLHDYLETQPLAPLIFLAAHLVGSLVFVPRTVFAVAAGLIWGLWWGVALTMIGGVGGAILCFVVARYLNAGRIKPESIPRFGAFLERAERGGWRTVALLRLVPVMPHTPVNYAFGLTQIPLGAYTVGTIVGLIPMSIFYADLGAAGSQAMLGGRGWIVPVAIAAVALSISLLLPRLRFARGQHIGKERP
jgi:uncharacterized membrane protein YdjX (TVP38/TMEM64 family)